MARGEAPRRMGKWGMTPWGRAAIEGSVQPRRLANSDNAGPQKTPGFVVRAANRTSASGRSCGLAAPVRASMKQVAQ